MPASLSESLCPRPWPERTVLITGGSSGTGLHTAERLLGMGARVVINGRDAERGQVALGRLRSMSPHVDFIPGDCADYGQAKRVVESAAARWDGLDVLISAGASGTGDPKPFAAMSAAEITGGLLSRYQPRVFPVHAAIPHLQGRPGANIVLLTTDAGRHATAGESVIGTYAAGIIQFTKTLGKELARDGLRVNAVSMTLTSGTRSWERIFSGDSFQSRLFEKAVDRFPFGAAPSADQVADVVSFLASPSAAQVTGQTLSVNGGLSFS